MVIRKDLTFSHTWKASWCFPINLEMEPQERPKEQLTCTMIRGEGVGPHLMESVEMVLEATGAPISFEQCSLSEVNPSVSMDLDDVVSSIKRNGIGLSAPFILPDVPRNGIQQNLATRLYRRLDLFANVIHAKSLPGLKTKFPAVDFAIVRQQTEGEYLAIEHEAVKGVVECAKITSREESQRIAKFAFDYAIDNNRKKVTCFHKANIMKLADGLFLESCKEVASAYPNIEFEAMIIDNACMQLVSRPQQFDVIVLQNLYGDIVGNMSAAIVGGAGVLPGASYGPFCTLFSLGTHHPYRTAEGEGIANPTAILLSTIGLLRHACYFEHANAIENALYQVLRSGKVRTKDVGGQASTYDFVSAIVRNINPVH